MATHHGSGWKPGRVDVLVAKSKKLKRRKANRRGRLDAQFMVWQMMASMCDFGGQG